MARTNIGEDYWTTIRDSINMMFTELYAAASLGSPTYTITDGSWGTARTRINSMYNELNSTQITTTPAATTTLGMTTTGTPSNEILTNGVFSGSTGWAVSGGWTIGTGTATFDDATNGHIQQLHGNLAQQILPNTAYTFTFNLSGTSGGGIYFAITSESNGVDGIITYVGIAEYTNGTGKTVTFTTPADIEAGGFRINASTAGDSGGTISNLSLIETV